VVPEYEVLQYLDGMAAFSKQKIPVGAGVERCRGGQARVFVGKLGTAATQMNKIAAEFTTIAPHYAVIVKGKRDNFDKATAELVTAFEEKFATKAPPSSIDVTGIVLATITAGAVTY
jgi:hypothetical protein